MARFRVAVVDDDPDALAVVSEYLELSGFEVLSCGDSAAVLARLEERPPDVVLMDVQMPGKDGFQLLAELRAHPRFEEVPVIFVSSLDRPNLKVKGLELGADDFVVKPFNRAELLARVRVSLRRSARFRRLAGCLGGDLADVPLPTLLQTLGLAGKTAIVRLLASDTEASSHVPGTGPDAAPRSLAEIVLDHGQFLGARFGSHVDRNAVTRLCLLESGRFETSFDRASAELSGVPRSIDAILLDAVVELDEVTEQLAAIGGMDVLLLRTTEASDAQDLAAAADAQTTPRRLLLTGPGSLSEAAAWILAAVGNGELTAAVAPRGG